MITKYDLFKQLEKETLNIIERNLQKAYQELRDLLLDMHKQLNAAMGVFETDQEIYERYIKNNEVIQRINTYSNIKNNVYWSAITYNTICKKRLNISNVLKNRDREWFRDKFRSDISQIDREFNIKCGNITEEEWNSTEKIYYQS